jgi:thiamine pyrophosphate-dependent acetolactate synthase large subunit-like protein
MEKHMSSEERSGGKSSEGVLDGGVSRRHFLGGSVAASAATVFSQTGAARASEPNERPVSAPPSAAKMEREVGMGVPGTAEQRVYRAGSDLMVQVMRDLDIEYVALNPGSTFEGLQESLINYGDAPNHRPEIISAMHEGSAVDMAHGYGRAQGKPMIALITGTVGLTNASNALYQAFHGHTPLIVIVGNDEENFLKSQTAQDIAGMVRPYTKWDAEPETLDEALTTLQEAYRQAMTPPCGPVVIVMNTKLQKLEYDPAQQLPVFRDPDIPALNSEQAARVAERLLAARNPHISVGRLRSVQGIADAVTLAEMLGASVDTMATAGPMSFPERHPLCGPGADKAWDYHLGLEKNAADVAILGPTLQELEGRDPLGIEFGWKEDPNLKRGPVPDKRYVLDAEASLPLLIAALRDKAPDDYATVVSQRAERNTIANKADRLQVLETSLERMRPGWHGSPVALGRLYAELWPLIKDLDWCLASPSNFSGRRHSGLWDHDRPHSYLGVYPAGAIGYCLGASMGAGLAAKDRDRIVINIQGDGDFNFLPGALWTAAHHKLPVLTIMHNNRAWHMEYMYIQFMAGVRGRGTDRAHIGTTFRDPYIDYAKIAEGYGIKAEGPIDDPDDMVAALKRGIQAVQNGEPYLIDLLTQPR